jgi:ankyrin repeat protein
MKYWAFISYSSKDAKTAKWLHQWIENFPVPKDFSGLELAPGEPLGKRLRPVFRDRDELPSSYELGPPIRHALEQSRYLIVLCSPNSAQSEWVEKEIQTFRELGKADRILAVILSGIQNAPPEKADQECFPPSFREPFSPLAADLREKRDGKARGAIKLLAGILETDFDGLYKRHLRRRRRLTITYASICFCLIAICGFLLHQASVKSLEAAVARKGEAQAKIAEASQRQLNKNMKEGLLKAGITLTPFIEAIIDGDTEFIGKKLKEGQNVDSRFGSDGYTPLMIASMAGSERSIKYLLDHGASYEASSSRGLAAIHIAARDNQLVAIRTFHDRGKDIDLRMMDGQCLRPMDVAAAEGNVEVLRLLHQYGVKPEAPGLAVPSPEEREELTKLEGPVPPRLFLEQSALRWAVFFGKADAVRYLLEIGADPMFGSEKPGGLWSIMEMATHQGRAEIIEILEGAIGDTDPMSYTLRLRDVIRRPTIVPGSKSRLPEMKDLIAKGADVNMPVPLSLQPGTRKKYLLELHLKSGRIVTGSDYDDVARILLDAGADPNKRISPDDKPPLHLATEGSNRSEEGRAVVMMLVDKGANLEAQDKYGFTALILACKEPDTFGDAQLVKYFLEKGAKDSYVGKPESKYPREIDALKYAIEDGNAAAAELIRKHRAKN